jgi:NitT/TauT family transport system substrate-binding protein
MTVAMSAYAFIYAPTMVANELGYFRDEGIDVDIVKTNGGAQSLAAVVSGDAQVNVGAFTSAFRARSKGADVILVGPSANQYSQNVVMSRDWATKHSITDKSPYAEKLKALKGMTIAVASAAAGGDQVLRLLAKEAGINADRDLTITAVGSPENMLVAISQGRVDGFTATPPASDEALKKYGAFNMFDLANGEVKRLDGIPYIGLVVRESWIKANPELAARFLRAEQRAMNTIHDAAGSKAAGDAIHKRFFQTTDKEFFDWAWQRSLSSIPKSLILNAADMDRIVEIVNEFEREPLDKSVVAKGWTNEYSEKALASMKK